jgi:hypothetical protein
MMKSLQMFLADCFDDPMQDGSSLTKPKKSFLADLVVL